MKNSPILPPVQLWICYMYMSQDLYPAVSIYEDKKKSSETLISQRF